VAILEIKKIKEVAILKLKKGGFMKNTEKLLNLIGEIDLKYVDEAEKAVSGKKRLAEDVQNADTQSATIQNSPIIIQNITEEEEMMSEKKNNKGTFMKRFLPIAACAVFAFAGIFAAVRLSKDKSELIAPGSSESTGSSAGSVTTSPIDSENGENTAPNDSENGENTTPAVTTSLDISDFDLPLLDISDAEVGAPFAVIKDNNVSDYLAETDNVEWSPTMTVYKSEEKYNSDKEQISGLEYDEMLEMLTYYVDKLLGEPVDESRVTVDFVVPVAGNEKRLNYIAGNAYFSVEMDGNVSVSLPDNFIPLDNMLNPYDIYWDANENYYTFTDEMIKATSVEVYEKTLPFFVDAMTAPKLATHYLSLSEYNMENGMYSRRDVEYRVVESGTPKRIFSKARCTLDYVTFHPIAADGSSESLTKQIAGIHFYHKIDPVAIGEYPVITAEQAKELLFSYQYIGNEKNSPIEENIVKCELVYPDSAQTAPVSLGGYMRNYGQSDTILMPYYRFWVEQPGHSINEQGYKFYLAYYVPAVPFSFISHTPESSWQGVVYPQ
jgi:hypothetical protein